MKLVVPGFLFLAGFTHDRTPPHHKLELHRPLSWISIGHNATNLSLPPNIRQPTQPAHRTRLVQALEASPATTNYPWPGANGQLMRGNCGHLAY